MISAPFAFSGVPSNSSLMPSYQALFNAGSVVRIGPSAELEEFRNSWKFHHPLTDEQLAFAGRLATVENVGFYHGGDVLYTLKDIPGIWHEHCLRSDEGADA